MAGFYIPLSGLDADTTSLNTIANNLSNMNTTAYKQQTTQFSTLFYQELSTNGSGDAIQEGTGVQVASNSTDFTTGAISGTNVSTDAAINGTGFFILDNSGSQLLTRAGDFQVSSTGTLETSAGQAVMGYAASSGTITTSGGLTDLDLPVGTVMQPSATTTFSMTQNLQSSASVGATTTGQVKVYDSLGNSYEASVIYKKTAANTWSYSISLPDTVTADVSPQTNAMTYSLASANSTVDPTTNLVITGPTATNGVTASITAPAVSSGETLATYANSLNTAIAAAGITGVSVTATTSGQLSIIGSGVTTTGKLVEDPVTSVTSTAGKDTSVKTFYFASANSTINSATDLTITGPTSTTGSTATTTAPTITSGETLSEYATALNTAISAAGITGVSATATSTGQIQISGSSVTLSGNVVQNPVTSITPTEQTAADATTYYFNSASSTLDPSTNLVITGPTSTAGVSASITAPTVTAGESIGSYATALKNALTTAGIVGVSVAATTTGQLTITGTGVTTTGSVVQVPESAVANSSATAGTNTYVFTDADVAADSNLSFTVPNGAGNSTITVTQSSSPETLLDYVNDVNAAFTAFNTAYGPASTMTASLTGSTISIMGTGAAAAYSTSGTLKQAGTSATLAGTAGNATTLSYSLGSSTATVDSTTNLVITGPNSNGVQKQMTAPTITAGENLTTYAASLQSALTAAGIVGVTVSANASGQLSIAGTDISTSGSLVASQIASLPTTQSTTYSFTNANSTVDPTTTLTITAPTETGATATITAPTVTSGETLAAYSTALQNALAAADISGVNVSAANGSLTISGTNVTTSGKLVQDPITTVSNSNSTVGSATYDLSSSTATLDPSTSLVIHGYNASGTAVTATVTPTSGESLASYAVALSAAVSGVGMQGVTIGASSSGVLTINAPSTTTYTGNLVQNQGSTTLSGTSGVANSYSYSLNSTSSTIDPATNLTITGTNSSGNTVSITAPTVSSGETLAQYVAALNTALTSAGLNSTSSGSSSVSVSSNNSGQLTISGTNISLSGNVIEDPSNYNVAANSGTSSTISYSLASNTAAVSPSTTLTITGPTAVAGVDATITPPTVVSGETLSGYATALNTALTNAGIVGVTVTATATGTLNISGTGISTSGNLIQDQASTAMTASSGTNNAYSYSFGSSNGVLETVNTGTNLTITGPTSTGGSATITAPTITSGETVADYVSALNTAIGNSGIVGATVSLSSTGVMSISGVDITTSGSVIGDPVSSTNTTGTLTFNSNGELSTPASDLSGVSFAGLSDGAASLDMNWQLYSSTGTANITQTSASSSTSATNQNGYTSGEYESFTIGSSGVITASYSNGETQNVGQIAIATVSNEEGLLGVGNTTYQTTAASGDMSIGIAGEGGRGSIEGSSLEASNVNISTEFSDLIIAQRAFEANSKAVTTFDTVTEETISMIH